MEVNRKLITTNYSKGRGGSSIQEITVHHAAGAILLENMYTMFNTASNAVSSHYGIRDNAIMQYVDEANTAWTNSNWAANCRAVTIEVSNNGGSPDWPVSNASYNTLINLIYDIANRNNLLPLVRGVSLTWHSLYKATGCPGPYLLARIDDIVKQVNALYKDAGNDYTSLEETTSKMFRVRETWEDKNSQVGAFKILENAKSFADALNGSPRYTVFDDSGNAIYPE